MPARKASPLNRRSSHKVPARKPVLEIVGVPTKRLIVKASPRNRRSSYKECLIGKAILEFVGVPTKRLIAKASPRNRRSSYRACSKSQPSES